MQLQLWACFAFFVIMQSMPTGAIEAQVGFWIKIIAENVLAGFMIWLYLKDRKQWAQEREKLFKIIKAKDDELKELNASINEQVIGFLRSAKEYISGNPQSS